MLDKDIFKTKLAIFKEIFRVQLENQLAHIDKVELDYLFRKSDSIEFNLRVARNDVLVELYGQRSDEFQKILKSEKSDPEKTKEIEEVFQYFDPALRG